MKNIRLFADSACDLDKEVLDELGISLFRLKVHIKDNTYLDRLDMQPEEFYRLIQEPGLIPTTSQISPGDFQEEFEKVLNESEDEIIYMAFSSGLSGTYQSACIARDMLNTDRITIIDTKSASVGYALTLIRASKALAAGKNKEEIIAEIMDNLKRVEHIFIVGEFEMLKRGGRVSATSAFIGNLLNIKVIANFEDGKIVPVEKVKGFKKARKELLKLMEQRGYNLSQQLIGISHSHGYEGALELKDMIAEKYGCREFVISEIGPVIGSHVGAGTYSVFFLRKE